MDLDLGGASGASQSPGDLIKDTDTASFNDDVIKASGEALVLVDFWADWCGPCKQLTPVLEKVVTSYGGKVRLAKLNVDQHPAIPGQLRIQSLPTIYAFRDGQPLDGFMGAQPESAIREFIERLLGDDPEDESGVLLEAASERLSQNDLQGAAEIYATILQQDGQNVAAIVGLANCYMTGGDSDRAEQTLSLVPPNKQSAPEVAQLRAAIELARQMPESAADTEALRSKVKSDGDDHQARLDLALALAAGGSKKEAVEQLLESFRRDPDWQDEAARKQLLQFFEAWGPTDPETIAGRRRLSSLLFS